MGVLKQIQTDIDNAALNMVTEYRNRLYADAQKLCGNATEAEDLVMQTFNRVFSEGSGYDESKGEFYPWMRGVMQRIYVRKDRRTVNRQTRPVEAAELEALMDADNCTIEEVMRDSDAEALRAALERLDPKYKQTLMLHYFSEMPVKEIAYVMKCPVGTVLWRMHVACRMLKKDLAQKLGKKPVAVLAALLLGISTLFAAYQTGLLGNGEEGGSGILSASEKESEQSASPSALVSQGGAGVPAAQDDTDSGGVAVPATLNEKAISNDNQQNTPQQTQETPTQEKTTMKLTSTLKSVAAAALTTAALASDGVTIDVTKAQQRYPWNGLVDIDYTIKRDQGESALDPAKHSVRISVVNRDVKPAVTNVAHVFRQGALPVSDGAHRVTWDANAEGINFKSQNVTVFAEVVRYAEKYMIIDVSEGSTAKVYPVTYMHGAPEGGFNKDEDKDEYKGNKIVLRLIPPGSFVMGSPTTEPGCVGKSGDTSYDTSAREVQHAVAITKPFYIGIFQITQKQYKNVMNDNPSSHTDNYCPVEGMTYNVIRGTADTGTHRYDWPHNQDVDMQNSFMGKLRAKCKEWGGETYDKDVAGLFDLPTDAQWEYACRARTTTPYNNGVACATDGSLDTQLGLLGCYTRNRAAKYPAVVGSYAPNDWGLYDMHGNVWEWCLDWYREDVQNIENPTLDPVGPGAGEAGSPKRIKRGGGFDDPARSCRSAFRSSYVPGDVSVANGFRLSMTLP